MPDFSPATDAKIKKNWYIANKFSTIRYVNRKELTETNKEPTEPTETNREPTTNPNQPKLRVTNLYVYVIDIIYNMLLLLRVRERLLDLEVLAKCLLPLFQNVSP